MIFENIEFESVADVCRYIEKKYDIDKLYQKVISYKSRHKELSYEQVLEYYIKKSINTKSRLYESKINIDGDKMTIIEYIDSKNITVIFEDETIKKQCSYNNFLNGKIRNPSKKSKYIGMHKIMNCGIGATVIDTDYAKGTVTVKFDDGFIKEAPRQSFTTGTIKHPNFNAKTLKALNIAKKHIGEKLISKYNEELEIIDAESLNRVLIRFNGTNITRWVTYKAFLSGTPYSKKHSNIKERYTLKQFCIDNGIDYHTLCNFIKTHYDKKVDTLDGYINAYNKYLEYKNKKEDTFIGKVKKYLKPCDDLETIYNRLKEFRRMHPDLNDEQVIIYYRPDCYINWLGEIVVPT